MSFYLSFAKNSKRHTCGMIFLNRTIIILHCLHFDSNVANIYKFKHLFGNLLHVCGVAVKALYSYIMTSLRQTSGINCNNIAKRYLDSRLQTSLINIACFWLFISASKSEL